MNLIAWLLFGTVVGLIGVMLESKKQNRHILGTILLGMGGALLGGVLASSLFRLSLEGFNTSSFLLSMCFSLLLLITGKAIQKI